MFLYVVMGEKIMGDASGRLSRVEGPIFIGRGWDEYVKMFNLDLDELKGFNFLDCAAGASSFTSRMSGLGFDVNAVDLLYGEDYQVLSERCREHLDALVDSLSKVEHMFVWSFFSSVEELKDHRSLACKEFINDYRNHGERYVKADISCLPFNDNSFKMVLCSHLLFIYDHRLDYRFHLNSIREMLRVSSDELRIYPIVKNRGKRSLFVERVIDDLVDATVEIVDVDYEFRRNGNEMMRIIKDSKR